MAAVAERFSAVAERVCDLLALAQQWVVERIMHELRRRVRVKAGRNPDPTLAIIDSQSVKTVPKGGKGVMTTARKRKAANAI